MGNLYAGRRAVKLASSIMGADRDPIIDRLIEAHSVDIERQTRRLFIPKTHTRVFRWPSRQPSEGYILYLDEDLLSVTTLKTKAQNTTPTTIVAADYFLEPANWGPPYDRIEIDQSSSAVLESGDSPQRSIEVVGSWGYGNVTRTGGTVSSGLASDATATSMVGSNASLVDVGDTLLIESEQVRVTEQAYAALAAITLNDAAVIADLANVSITVGATHGIVKGEIIKVDSEEMYVSSVATNVLTVIRAWNASVLASHANATAVHINRTLTIVRGVNGTTGATHANATAVSVYDLPKNIVEWCIAEVIAAYQQEQSGWGRVVGTGEGQAESSGRDLARLRKSNLALYKRHRLGVI